MNRNERCPWMLPAAAALVVQILPAAIGYARSPVVGDSEATPIALSGPGLAVPGGSTADNNARVHTVRLSMEPPYYSPQDLTIEAGDVVEWVNTAVNDVHSACDRKGSFTSVDIPAGGQWCFRFDHPGQYSYVCRMHPWMRATVTVVRRALTVERQSPPPSASRRAASVGLNVPARRLVLPVPASDATRPILVAAQPTDSSRAWFFDTNTLSFGYLDRAVSRIERFDTVRMRSAPETLLAASDGAVWFTTAQSTSLARFDPQASTIREYPLGEGVRLTALTASPGALWAADAGRNRIVRLANHWTTSYTIPTPNSRPRALVVSSDGDLWFAQADNRLGCIRGEDVKEFDLAGLRIDVASMAFDAAGNLWLTSERGESGRIAADAIRAARGFEGPLTPQPCPVPDGTGSRPPKTR